MLSKLQYGLASPHRKGGEKEKPRANPLKKITLAAGAMARAAWRRLCGGQPEHQEQIQSPGQVAAEMSKLLRAVEQSPASIVITDLNGTIEYVNPRFTQVTGYTFAEAIGQNPRILKTERTEPETHVRMWEALKAGKEWSGEFVNRKKDGSQYIELANISPITDQNGVVTHYLAVKEDITERKRIEEELRASEARYRAINQQLNQRIAEVEQLQVELREQALHDPLTGLYNRRFLDEVIEKQIALARRESQPVSVIVSDIDFFKRINDTAGHRAGDRFLVAVARLMEESTRSSDVVCRYGGEEFLLVLPGATLSDAARRAEQIRCQAAAIALQHEGRELKATLSFGVATFPDHGSAAEEIIIKADRALYYSKDHGRNQVTAWGKTLD